MNNESRKLKKLIHCPKCKSINIGLNELVESCINYLQDEDGCIDIGSNGYGNIVGVTADCYDCNHSWKLRKVLQIDDLFEEEECL